MRRRGLFCLGLSLLFSVSCGQGRLVENDGNKPQPPQVPVRLQLNWFHDPSFAGEYLLSQGTLPVIVREGGPGIQPIAEVLGRRSELAIVGADLFLQKVGQDKEKGGASDLVAIFVDFQRNPVGWVLHPKAARDAGLSQKAQTPSDLNEWLARQVAAGKIRMGDKRGTETTAVWMEWRRLRSISKDVSVTPVGFDPAIVLDAPRLAFPVYLNEEPLKLSEKIGAPVVVFDPAVDGLSMYGNVVVAHRSWAAAHATDVARLQGALRAAWEGARKDPAATAALVAKYYGNVPLEIVRQQVAKTTEFVFFGDVAAGTMDLGANGRWAHTLGALQRAGAVSGSLGMDDVAHHVIRPQ